MKPCGVISKKAPGDRPLAAEEVRAIAALVRSRRAEGKVRPLPRGLLRSLAAILRERRPPPVLSLLRTAPAARVVARIARVLERGGVPVYEVDLGPATGFPRENARPVCEVLLAERDGDIVEGGRPRAGSPAGARPAVFLPAAFAALAADRPHLVLQALLHPLLEWSAGLPHMVAVLCEAAYDAELDPSGGEGVSDLNRFIAAQAAADRDAAYFDRILGTAYEPDEFRMEELAVFFGDDPDAVAEVVRRARAVGIRYRELVAELAASLRAAAARERVSGARRALDEGDADGALVALRGIEASGELAPDLRAEIKTLTDLAVRALALDADPAYEGLVLEKGTIRAGDEAGPRARAFAALLESAADMVRRHPAGADADDSLDPLGERGAPRFIHVGTDLERPSAKFIDGHDRVHWVFEKSFVDALVAAKEEGTAPDAVAALLACRFVRDGAFPDEKLKIDRQLAAAVKGAVEGYRFFHALPSATRTAMEELVEARAIADPLFRLFLALGGETHPSRAARTIRSVVGRTHSYDYVRYPDTSLAGRVVVVTGGGTGMGRALALEAVLRGASVAITGRRPAPLEATRQDMQALARYLGLSCEAIAVQGDVSDPRYVGEMFDRIESEFGRIDILFNNAGVPGPVEFGSAYREEHFEEYRRTVAIHLTGSWLASLEAARIMERQRGGGTIVMVGTFYSESVHRHVLHAYPGRLPYTCAQAAKLALGDYLAWALAGRRITVLSVNPSAVTTDRIRRGEGVFDRAAQARARVGRIVSAEVLERDTLDRTVTHEFVRPRDFARAALSFHAPWFRRTVNGQRLPMGGVAYEQPPGVVPALGAPRRFPDLVAKVALVTADRLLVTDVPLLEAAVQALARSGASVVLAGSRLADMEKIAVAANAAGGEGMATVCPANLADPAEVQALFDRLPRLDLLLHFTGSVDWKRPLLSLAHEEWCALVDRFGYIPRLLVWQAERRIDRDGGAGTVAIVGPDLSGVPSVRERHLVQVFQSMLRPAVATEAMERALMRKAREAGTAPGPVGDMNIALVLPGRTDGRNRSASPEALAATLLWLAGEGKGASGLVLLPDEQNATVRLPRAPAPAPGTMAGRVVVVTGGIRNLGRAISLRLASEGATVVAASRRPRLDGSPQEVEAAQAALREADATLARMRESGGRGIWIDTDVSDPRRVRALVDEARNRFGRIDGFVNNAGAGGDFSLFGEVLRAHRAGWEAVLRANFLGPWAAVSYLAEVMSAASPPGGTIVNVSTHYADHPYLFRTIYTVSKILLKALTLALEAPLAERGIHMADVAPSLIAGPRMDWVMRNYAGRFASQFDSVPDLPLPSRRALAEAFLRSFDTSLAAAERAEAARAFAAALGEAPVPRAVRAGLQAWYGRVGEWFRATVPADPPSNEEAAEAVVYALKNARFMENRFLGVSSLGTVDSFPGPCAASRRIDLGGASLLLLSAGGGRQAAGLRQPLEALLTGAGARLTAVVELSAGGVVEIARPPLGEREGRRGFAAPTVERRVDLSDPAVLESWLDNALLGLPRPAGAIVIAAPLDARRSLLARSPGEMEDFLRHLTRLLNLTAEALRAVRPGGHVVLVAPREEGEEAILLRAALRQMARTVLAEAWFLPPRPGPLLSLLSAPNRSGEEEFARRAADLLTGRIPAHLESIAVGFPRP